MSSETLIIILSPLPIFAMFVCGCWLLLKFSRKNSQTDHSANIKILEAKIEEINSSINNALNYSSQLVPLESALERKSEEKIIRAELEKELKTLKQLEMRLNSLQTEVEVAEASHHEIKRGKEASEELSKAIKERKDKLDKENNKIINDIDLSLDQLSSLSKGLSLTKDQDTGMKIIFNGISNSKKQIQTLVQAYKQSSGRFINLQAQYQDLEKEFTKLVEKELQD
jgi:chromosome segregation ATPase